MANIQDKETHFTFHSNIGTVGDSFFYLPHWYKGNYILVTMVDGLRPSENAAWLEYVKKRGLAHEMMGAACLIMPESVEDLFVDERTFTGDSEMYVCNKKPDAGAVPSRSYMPGTQKFGEELPEGFLEDLRKLDALAYMSDGDGVNIAHKAKEEIIYYVLEMKM